MSNEMCRFGYTESSCVQKDNPPCGGNCELKGTSYDGNYRSYRQVHRNR